MTNTSVIEALKILKNNPEQFEEVCADLNIGRSPKGEIKKILRLGSKKKINAIIYGRRSVRNVLDSLPTIGDAQYDQLKSMPFNVVDNKLKLKDNYNIVRTAQDIITSVQMDTNTVKCKELITRLGVTKANANSLLIICSHKDTEIRKFLEAKFNITEMKQELKQRNNPKHKPKSKPSKRGRVSKIDSKNNIKTIIKMIKDGHINFDIQKKVRCDNASVKNIRFILEFEMPELTSLLYHIPITKVVRIAESLEERFTPSDSKDIDSIPDITGGKINVKTLNAYQEFLNQIISDRNLNWKYTDKENIVTKLETLLNIIRLT